MLPSALAVGEPQLALRAGAVLTPHLTRTTPPTPLVPPAAEPAWHLDTTGEGLIEHLSFVPSERATQPLSEGQVRVAVHAAGLNFRDVLVGLGMVPGQVGMGSEGAGVITEVGPGVHAIGVGDRVMGLFPEAFGPLAVADHRMLVRMPTGWSFTRAASVPVVFLTAYYGLHDLAGLRTGESVLVHSAAGGVGMAAVQLARHFGAEVFGTAGPSKQETLRTLGLDDAHIASSRTLEFEQRFMDATEGGGIDVVLDSMADEFVDASLRLTADGGRFMEMGKTDIRDATEVERIHPGVSYRAFDLFEVGAERIQQMLTEVLALFDEGVLEPLPTRTWDIRSAPEAYRHMSQALHVGKLVLTVRPDFGGGTVLVTGGTGALGGV
ncbi:beta-ketoacyl synthase, partial [Streptomyces tsukubensis]